MLPLAVWTGMLSENSSNHTRRMSLQTGVSFKQDFLANYFLLYQKQPN